MNRTIKFRLLSPSKNVIGYEKWYEGSANKETGAYSAEPCWLYSQDGKVWTTHPIKGRYKDAWTGLTDKNGKEIYEGDVVEGLGANSSVVKWSDFYCRFQRVKNGACFSMELASALEIIGNIYENPELLKGNWD